MTSVAAIIPIAIEPAAADAVTLQHKAERSRDGDANEHFAGVVTNGQNKIAEKLHAFSCRPIEVLS